MVPESVVEQLETYFELLARWTVKINLTSLPLQPPTAEALDRLLIEPLLAAKHVENTAITWFDLGSRRRLPCRSIEDSCAVRTPDHGRIAVPKAAFLREAGPPCGLSDTTVLTARVEDLRPDSPADLVTIRALGLDESILESVRRLLGKSARLLAFASSAMAAPPRILSPKRPPSVSKDSRILLLSSPGAPRTPKCSTWNIKNRLTASRCPSVCSHLCNLGHRPLPGPVASRGSRTLRIA